MSNTLPRKNLTFEISRVQDGVLLQATDAATGHRVRLEMTCAGSHSLAAILERCADTDVDLARDYDTTIGGRVI